MCRLVSLDKLHAVSPTYVYLVFKGFRLNCTTALQPVRLPRVYRKAADGPETGTIHIYYDMAWPRHKL